MGAAIRYGMTIDEFYNSTSRDLTLFIKIKSEQVRDDIERQYDHTRKIMWASIAAMNGDKIKPSDLIPLSGDVVKVKTQTAYEKQQMIKTMKEMDKDMGI